MRTVLNQHNAAPSRRGLVAIWDRAGNVYLAEWLPYGRVTKLRTVEA